MTSPSSSTTAADETTEAGVVEGGSPAAAEDRRSTGDLLRHVGDAVAVALLVGVLIWWEPFDGGRERDALAQVSWIAVAALPIAVREAAALPRLLRVLLSWYGVGGVIAVLAAVERSGWVTAALIYGMAPIVALAATRIWRRSWGPAALLGLLTASFAMYTYRSWLQWWGSTMADIQPLWMPLSWRNQSGALTGAFGLLFLGIGMMARRLVAVGALMAAGISFAGLWLSSSRGAIAFTAAAALVVLLAALRSTTGEGRRTVVAGLLGAAAIGAVVTIGLTSMIQPGAASPLDSRDQEAVGNAVARINHAEAAVRMFVDRPLTGKGLGSYRVVALDFTDPDANLTSSAHDEYVEVLGEGGLVFGLPFVLLSALLGAAALRRSWRGVEVSETSFVDLRAAATVGLVGVVAVIGAHSSFDFDWTYPVLPGLLAIGAAPLLARATATDASAPQAITPLTLLAASGVALLLPLGVAGDLFERSQPDAVSLSPEEYAVSGTPWYAKQRGDIAAQLLADGRLELARTAVEDALEWNPANDRLVRIRNLVRYEQGELSPQELADTLVPGESRFQSYIDVADWLIEDQEFAIAGTVLDDAIEQMETYASWGSNSLVIDAGIRQVFVAAELDGCTAAEQQAAEVFARPAADTFDNIDEVRQRVIEDACAAAAV